MEDKNIKPAEKKEEPAKTLPHDSHEHAHNSPTEKHTHDSVKQDAKKEDKKDSVKSAIPKVKKELAIARGPSLHMSKRHGMYICAFIKGKTIDAAIADLEQVRLFKKIVPFKGEIPHRKGKGMMSGRYPVTAAGLIIPMLKTLKGNVAVNGLDITKTRITTASANWASRPQRRGGQRAKRTYIILEAKEVTK